MKKSRKWTFLGALAVPMMFSTCVTGFREALIEGGFAFVEESAVELLQGAIPIHLFLGAEEAAGEAEHG